MLWWNWNEKDWPRERLMRDGLDSLSIGDLLAIVFNTGYKGESVREMAGRLLKEYGSHALKDQRNVKDIQARLGLPRSPPPLRPVPSR